MKDLAELDTYRNKLKSRLAGLVGSLRDAYENIRPEDRFRLSRNGQPSPQEILIGLWQSQEQVFSPYLERIRSEPVPLLALVEPLREMPDLPAEDVLDRLQLLLDRELASLDEPGIWNRTVRHPVAGLRTFQWWMEHNLSEAEKRLKVLLEVGEKNRV